MKSELLTQIDKVIAWDAGLNSDQGPLNLGEAMQRIRWYAVKTETELEGELYRNHGASTPVWKTQKEHRS